MTEKKAWESKKALAFALGLVAILASAYLKIGAEDGIVKLTAAYIGGQGLVDAWVRGASIKHRKE